MLLPFPPSTETSSVLKEDLNQLWKNPAHCRMEQPLVTYALDRETGTARLREQIQLSFIIDSFLTSQSPSPSPSPSPCSPASAVPSNSAAKSNCLSRWTHFLRLHMLCLLCILLLLYFLSHFFPNSAEKSDYLSSPLAHFLMSNWPSHPYIHSLVRIQLKIPTLFLHHYLISDAWVTVRFPVSFIFLSFSHSCFAPLQHFVSSRFASLLFSAFSFVPPPPPSIFHPFLSNLSPLHFLFCHHYHLHHPDHSTLLSLPLPHKRKEKKEERWKKSLPLIPHAPFLISDTDAYTHTHTYTRRNTRPPQDLFFSLSFAIILKDQNEPNRTEPNRNKME